MVSRMMILRIIKVSQMIIFRAISLKLKKTRFISVHWETPEALLVRDVDHSILPIEVAGRPTVTTSSSNVPYLE